MRANGRTTALALCFLAGEAPRAFRHFLLPVRFCDTLRGFGEWAPTAINRSPRAEIDDHSNEGTACDEVARLVLIDQVTNCADHLDRHERCAGRNCDACPLRVSQTLRHNRLLFGCG